MSLSYHKMMNADTRIDQSQVEMLMRAHRFAFDWEDNRLLCQNGSVILEPTLLGEYKSLDLMKWMGYSVAPNQNG